MGPSRNARATFLSPASGMLGLALCSWRSCCPGNSRRATKICEASSVKSDDGALPVSAVGIERWPSTLRVRPRRGMLCLTSTEKRKLFQSLVAGMSGGLKPLTQERVRRCQTNTSLTRRSRDCRNRRRLHPALHSVFCVQSCSHYRCRSHLCC
jgi:hypothetical protein